MTFARRWCRRAGLPLCDAAAWTVGLGLATGARYDWVLDDIDGDGFVGIAALAVLVQVAVGSATHLYRRRHRIGSVREAIVLTYVVAATGLVVAVVDAGMSAPPVPRSVPMMAAVATLVVAGGLRLAVRARRDAATRPDAGSALRVVVYGAGRTGEQLVRSMMEDRDSEHRAVAMLDDDPALCHQHIGGVPVLGSGNDVADVVRERRADLLVIALRDPDCEPVRAAIRVAERLGVRVKFLPPLGERLKPSVGVSDLREIDINELLGRCPVETDAGVVVPMVTGRRVLVTGAGGSIGSELCRQIARFDPAELLMLDRDESALHGVRLSIYGTALLDSPDVILADIRDGDAVDAVFAARRPHIVFHAAALKHLPILEQYPEEAWKTNVLGTVNVLDAAARHRVRILVNISTDKAADPISVLGRSKRIGERLVAGLAGNVAGTFLSVRFGNVLGSRGSVVATFVEQLAAGAPVTVTHPDVSRYFMTVSEAVQLVLQTASLGVPGRVHVLDMGPRVRIVELAQQLMDFTRIRAPIVFTGLREGEKLHEDLFGAAETDRHQCHPAIFAVPVPGLSPDLVELQGLQHGFADALAELCATHDACVNDALVLTPARKRALLLEAGTRPMPAQP